MAETTAIEWADATLNLWWGCTKVSEGCKHCYADSLSNRYQKAVWGPKGTRVEVKGWRQTLNKISKRAKDEGRRLMVFCQSMSDTFEGPDTCGGVDSENWNTIAGLQTLLLHEIMLHPEIDFLILTKRPENVIKHIDGHNDAVKAAGHGMHFDYPANAWFGTSVENQETADKRIPELLKIPAKVRFLSCEPLIGAVDLNLGRWKQCHSCQEVGLDGFVCPSCNANSTATDKHIHWVICGGESGAKARPMHPAWARSLRDQCQEAGVPFFFKQWGEWAPLRGTGYPHSDDDETSFPWFWLDVNGNITKSSAGDRHTLVMVKEGKKAAGRLLDGQTWSGSMTSGRWSGMPRERNGQSHHGR